MLVIPVSGKALIAITVGFTLLNAIFSPFVIYIPHFVAQLIALIYMDVFSMRRLWLRARHAVAERQFRRRTAHLYVVKRDDDRPPRWLN
jgi:hypothetical protein